MNSRKIVKRVTERLGGLLPLELRKAAALALHRSIGTEVAHRLAHDHGHILTGLFAGTKISEDLVHPSNLSLAHILGQYERPVQKRIGQWMPGAARFIDIGCASGYYTVGVASKFKKPALGFDIDREQIDIANRFAVANGVGDLARHSQVAAEHRYSTVLQPGDFALIDIEGAEAELFDADFVGAAGQCCLLVECHAVGALTSEGMAENLAHLLGGTHDVETFKESCEIDLSEFDASARVSRDDVLIFGWERRRYVQNYILACPRDRSAFAAL